MSGQSVVHTFVGYRQVQLWLSADVHNGALVALRALGLFPVTSVW